MPDPIATTHPTPPLASATTNPSATNGLSESQLAAIVEAAYLRDITKR